MKTKQLIHQFHNIFNMLKGFSAGYTSSNSSQMLVENEGRVYKITIEELGEGNIDQYINEEL